MPSVAAEAAAQFAPPLRGVLPPSALPWYAVNASDPRDQFFTKREVAARCWKSLNDTAARFGADLRRHLFIEPSAGEGCFTDLLPKSRRISLDIAPRHSETERADFLQWSPPETARRFAVVGNPPFGVRGAMALAFVNRAALFADLVGFVLPMTFESDGKGGALTRVDSRLSLLHSEELPPGSFYDADGGGERDINTVWQVWGALSPPLPRPTGGDCGEFVEIRTVCTSPARRCGLARMDEYDFFLQGTFYDNRPPQVVRDFAEVKYGSGYGVIIKKRKREVSRALRAADWSRHSSRATNHCRHIRMRHIREVLATAGLSRGAGQ